MLDLPSLHHKTGAQVGSRDLIEAIRHSYNGITMVSESKRAKFLGALFSGSSVTKACKFAGVGRTTIYDERDRNSEFRRDWDEAIAAQGDVLIDEVRTRALDREDPKSHTLLMFLLKGLRPEFRDNYKTETKVVHAKALEIDLSGAIKDEALAILLEQGAKGDAPGGHRGGQD